MNRRLIIAALAAVVLLSGCGGEDAERTEITLLHGWGTMENDHVAMRRIYEDFERNNPDIRLNLLSMPSSQEVIVKANDMLAVGEVPDLIFTGGLGRDTMYRFMVNKGYALDLMPYIEADKEFSEDVSPVIKQYWSTSDGRLYTISDVLLYSGGYWYNEEIFRRAGIDGPPGTWGEFEQACEKISAWARESGRDVSPILLNMENSMYLMDLFLLEAGEDSREAMLQHRIEAGQPQLSTVIDRLSELHSYSRQSRYSYGYRDILKQFNEGKTAIYINGVWAGPMINEDLSVRYAPLPASNGQSVSCISSCLGYVVGNTGDSEKMEAAVRFVKYMVSDQVQERIVSETGQVPSNPAIQPSEGMPRYLQAVEAVRDADIHLDVPDNVWDNARAEVFKDGIMDVLNGELSRQTFMDLLR